MDSFRCGAKEERVEVISRTENCIVDIERWLVFNRLSLNAPKSDMLNNVSPRRTGSVPGINIGCEWVAKSRSVRDLGVWLDEGMTMQQHISMICKSANASLYKISRIRKYLDQTSIERLIHAFVTSRLDSNNSVLYGLPDKALVPLQRIQNRAARILSRTKKHDHITPVLYRLHWLPVKQRIKFKILLMCFKVVHGMAPAYLNLTRVERQRATRSSADTTLLSRRSRTKFGDRCFSTCGPRLWNDLPRHIRGLIPFSVLSACSNHGCLVRPLEGR